MNLRELHDILHNLNAPTEVYVLSGETGEYEPVAAVNTLDDRIELVTASDLEAGS